MTFYKLIKEYPGSPKLGFIMYFKKHCSTSFILGQEGVYENFCKDKPEFWLKSKQDLTHKQFCNLSDFSELENLFK